MVSKAKTYFRLGLAIKVTNSYEVDDLKSIEIIRRPASALYGVDVLGSFVLLGSKIPEDYISEDNNFYTRLNTSYSDANDMAK